jgi:outer membrane biosynthesis protein TonB
MASESLTPPPSGGSAKYIVVLLLLLAGGLGVYLATSKEEPKPTPPPEVKSVERPTSLANNTIEIPEEEVDAGAPPEEPPQEVKKHRGTAQDPWSCPGDIPVADIKKVLGEAQSSIRACYERALRNNNQLQGSVALEVRVGGNGHVDNSRVRGNLRDPEVSKCIQNLAKNWRFPPPSGGNCAVVGAPYNFTPKN